MKLEDKMFNVELGNTRGKYRLKRKRNSENKARFYAKDIKEFLRRLKMYFDDGLEDEVFTGEYVLKIIEELAGKSLMEKEE